MPGRAVLQARLAPRGYYRAVGALRKRRCKAGNHECLRERLARRQVAALPVMRERPHQHGIGGPRRGRLALTINRHGRLTQRSHCCDPCSPRRCAATGAKHPLQSMVLWTRASSSREASATRTTIATHPLASARGARAGHLRVHVGLCDGVELLRPRPAVVVVASRMRTLMLAAQGSVVDAGRSARLSWRRT